MSCDLRVRIGPLELANPVGVASGTFGYGAEYEELVDLDALGAIYTKAVTKAPRPGNAVPRIVETPAGMLNSIGLANPGLEAFVDRKLPELRKLRAAVFVNVAGSSEDEYLEVVERIEAAAGPWAQPGSGAARSGVDGYEINVSCPNVRHGGLAFGTDPAQVERLTAAIRARTARALVVKLTPNVADVSPIARAAETGGADAVSLINTLVGMVIDVRRRRPALAMGTGGLSGPAVRPVGVACVHKAARAVKIPVIGLGGITCADDALQYLLAGASAVQVGTGTFVDPRTAAEVLAGVQAWMEAQGVARVEDIRGMLLA
ncbi:MAG: dihydroorotate dehydrogenase [Spirochaetaceae bacterium]|nr:dihydroorotate dehydrogenase [Spirochaetaceae bacterium]